MFEYPLMAHAFGGYQGHTYCNTRAALENGIANGYQYYEVDLSCTWDGRLVLCHGWTEANCRHTGFVYSPSFRKMTYTQIMGMKVHGDEIMDARQFYQMVKDQPWLFELDFHEVTGEKAQRCVRALLEDFEQDEKTLDERFLVQVYSRQMFFDIDSVHHFKYYQYLVGKNMDKLDEIIAFCREHGICAVAIRANLAKPASVRKLKEAGLSILCYTVQNDVDYAKKLLESGVDTICTDWITPAMLTGEKHSFGKNPFRVYYNSGIRPSEEKYSILIREKKLEGELKELPSGNMEFRDGTIWPNDGAKALAPNYFSAEGKRFAGWKMRVTVDGKMLWYCNDGCYHGGGDIKKDGLLQPFLFEEEALIPRWTFKKNEKLIMVAVWSDEALKDESDKDLNEIQKKGEEI